MKSTVNNLDIGYKASVADKCVFTHVDANDHLIIVAVYVDDFLFISKSLKFVESSKFVTTLSLSSGCT